MRPRVLVIETGGTIGSRAAPGGDLSAAMGLQALVKELSVGLDLDLEISPWLDRSGDAIPPEDSCNIGPAHWASLAAQILQSDADGVVILHGTDTLAWTASALSLALPPRHIPIVMTGAMRPANSPRSDARRNVRLALAAAAGRVFPLEGEVVIAFAGALSRGVRTTKISSRTLDAFASPSLPKLRPARARALAAGAARWQATKPNPARSGGALFSPSIARVSMTPGLTKSMLNRMVDALEPEGVLLELYGVGSAPEPAQVGRTADDLAERGIVCVAVSACIEGGLDLTLYASSRPLRESQLISADAMTAEAAQVKLMWACALLPTLEERRSVLLANVCGER